MHSLAGFSTIVTVAVLAAAPALAMPENGRLRLAQATAQSGPPSSGWTAPGAAQPAAPPPPSSGWSPPSQAQPSAAPPPPSSGWSAPRQETAAPSGPPAGGWGGTGSQRDCGAEFLPLRQEAEKKAAEIKKASTTKKAPIVCQAFRNFAVAEAKVVKYVEEHGAECRIPAEAAKTMKANHAKTIEIRTKVCAAAEAPAPRAPSLSDALGTSRVPTAPSSGSTAKRGGTFDTLTGNSLAR